MPSKFRIGPAQKPRDSIIKSILSSWKYQKNQKIAKSAENMDFFYARVI